MINTYKDNVTHQKADVANEVADTGNDHAFLAKEDEGDLFVAVASGLLGTIGHQEACVETNASEGDDEHGAQYGAILVEHVRHSDCASTQANDNEREDRSLDAAWLHLSLNQSHWRASVVQ